MKTLRHLHLIPAALLALGLTACRTGSPGSTVAITDAPTRLVETRTDRSGTTITERDNTGRAAAADGQAVASTQDILIAMAAHLPKTEWTYTENIYSTLDQPNRQVVESLKEQHKNILAEMTAAAAAGAQKDYDDLAQRAASIAGEIAKRLAGLVKDEAPGDGDKISMINRTLSVGKDHTRVPASQATEFGQSVRARVANPNLISTTKTSENTDTSTTAEIRDTNRTALKMAELQAKLLAMEIEAEAAKAKPAVQPEVLPAPVPPVQPIPGEEVDPDTTDPVEPGQPIPTQPGESVPSVPAPTEPVTLKNAQAVAAKWYPKTTTYTHGNTAFDSTALWKPVSEPPRSKLVVVIPAFKFGRILSVTVDGETNSLAYSIANGYRANFHFSKPGSQYTGTITIATTSGTYKLQVKNPAARTTLALK